MRTPGNDFELAVGFCVTEGLLRSPDDLDTVAYCLAGQGEQEYNIVTVKVRQPVDRTGHQRAFVANASCGLCGKTTLDDVEQHCQPVGAGPVVARVGGQRAARATADRADGVRRHRRPARGGTVHARR